MKFLRKILLIFLTFLLIFTEARVNTLLSDIDYIEMLPFLIYIFYVSLYSFSSGSSLVLVLSGFYFDLFLTDNFLGYTSIKFLLICTIIHYLYTRLSNGIVTEFTLFYLSALIYKFEVISSSLGINFIYIIIICLPNYFLFKILASTLRRDVFSTKI